MKKYSIFVSLLLLSMIGCKDSEVEQIDYGFDYLPLQIGYSSEYEVDSIFYDPFEDSLIPDTIRYRIVETIVDTAYDLAGKLNYILDRESFLIGSESRLSVQRKLIAASDSRIESYAANRREVVFTFPVKEGNEWDANAFNNDEELNYTFERFGEADTLGEFVFDSTVSIIQFEDTNNFIFKRFAEERYAKNVGRYRSTYQIIETQLGKDSGLLVMEKLVNFSR